MKYDFLILGSSGLQGRIVARDLLQTGYKVAMADLYREGSEKNLAEFRGSTFTFVDLRRFDTSKKFLKDTDATVVINCAEGDYNLDVYTLCLEIGRHVVDLGSDIPMTKRQLSMNTSFRRAGLTAITGCGSTPGINNVMTAYAAKRYRDIDTIELGFAWDSNVKKFVVPFSIESIIEELTEPAPVFENGEWLEKNPLETEVVLEFREIGTERCYIVRHPETYTFSNAFKKLGLRNIRFYAGFPDHTLETVRKMIELHLGAKDLLGFEGLEIRPVDALSRILTVLPRPDGYSEKENLWVEITGHDSEGHILITKMECLVSTLPGWQDAGCNIDTGFPASIVSQMILDNRISARGSFVPEEIVPELEFFAELKLRGMVVYQDGVALTHQVSGANLPATSSK